MMLAKISPTLDEILQVRGCPLEEDELWTLLRKIITDLHQTIQDHTSINLSAKNIKLLPNGKLQLLEEYLSSENKTQQSFPNDECNYSLLQNIALLLLWCAAYNLDEMCPLNISSNLQTLLVSMCEQNDVCTLDHVKEICCHQLNAKPSNDSEVISNLSSSILGKMDLPSIQETHIDRPVEMEHSKTTIKDVDTLSSILQDSFSWSNSPFSNDSSLIENVKDESGNNPSNIDDVTSNGKSKKIGSNLLHHGRYNAATKPTFASELPFSVLKVDDKVPTLHIDLQSSDQQMIAFYVQFVNHRKIEVVTRSPETTSALDILQSSLSAFLSSENTIEIDQLMHFALAVWKDSDFYFFDNSTTLDKIRRAFPLQNTLYIRVFRFSIDPASISSHLQTSMYIQLRADTINERITATPDEALSLAALALQCELGDYKSEYGNDYYSMDEFVPCRLSSQISRSFIATELVSMHRQLAGIGETEARLLFLRKSQKLEDYGVNFFKAFRQKSCKDKSATWLAVGPRGISNFDIQEDSVRIKRHNFYWSDLKKFSFKSRKIALTKLTPEVKLKFYQKETARAKYIVTVIGKLHSYYSSLKAGNEISALSLFDDITGLSSSLCKSPFSPPTKHSTPVVGGRRKSQPKTSSWTYNTPHFKRNSKVIRKHSSSLSTSTSKSNQSEQSKNADQVVAKQNSQTPLTVSGSAVAGLSTQELVMKEMQQVLEEEPSSSSSSRKVYQITSSANDETPPIPTARTKRKVQTSAKRKSFPEHSQVVASTSSHDYVSDDNIHETARNFYARSLSEHNPVPTAAEKLNSSLLKVVDAGV